VERNHPYDITKLMNLNGFSIVVVDEANGNPISPTDFSDAKMGFMYL
jgi:hypothetical protein